MDALVIYLLKMLTCSAILYGYYRLALFNERFHQWNRFYILAAFILSIIVPFISVPVLADDDQNGVTRIISKLPWNAIGSTDQNQLTWQQVVLIIIGLTSVVFILKLIWGIIRIVLMRQKGVPRFQYNIQLIISFFSVLPVADF